MKITLSIYVGILLINRVDFFKSLSDQTWLDILLLIMKHAERYVGDLSKIV